MPLKLSYTLLFVLLFVSSGVVHAGSPKLLETLPVVDVFPLVEANACGCSTYRKGSEMSLGNAVMSSFANSPTLVQTRIRMKSETVELAEVSQSKKKLIYVNRYRRNKIALENRFKEVSYQQYCGEYADAPTHGSCFIGTLDIASGVQKEKIPIATVCGC